MVPAINLFCNPFGNSGYAVHARSLLGEFYRAGIDIACFATAAYAGQEPEEYILQPILSSLSPRQDCIGVKLDVPEPPRVATFSGKRRIFYTVFETDRIPARWVGALNTVDEVWTTSEWGRGVFHNCGVTTPVQVVPEGVDTNEFYPPDRPQPSSGTFRFLAVAKFEARKNFEGLFRAFARAFRPSEAVELLVHCGHRFSEAQNPFRLLVDLNVGPHAPIRFSEPCGTTRDMLRLYHSADVFVLPTRGEGWGLPIIEAMACGLPVITTGIGPVTEYANDQTALLLDYRLIPAVGSNVEEVFSGSRWAEPDEEQLIEYMRWSYEHPDKGRLVGMRAAAEIRSKWTWRRAAEKAVATLNGKP